MDILIKTTIISPITNKYQRGDQFRTDEKKGKREAQEWDIFLLQEQLKLLMYVDRSSRGYSKKEIFIDELNFKIAYV